jgi:hypothetical protein
MRGVIWKFWSVIFGLAFLFLFTTEFGRFGRDFGIPLTFTILMAVGCFASVKLARLAVDRAKATP